MPVKSSDVMRRSMNHHPDGGKGDVSCYCGTVRKRKTRESEEWWR